jgi:hypothetical protein
LINTVAILSLQGERFERRCPSTSSQLMLQSSDVLEISIFNGGLKSP